MRQPTTFKRNEVEAIIKEYIPSVYLKCENGDVLIYLLPDESKMKFYELLQRLENNKESLGINRISISVTTLEDVFLKVGTAAGKSDTLKSKLSTTECKFSFIIHELYLAFNTDGIFSFVFCACWMQLPS